MNVVIDSNVLLSAIFYPGSKPYRIVTMAIDKEIEAFATLATVKEYKKKAESYSGDKKKFKERSIDMKLFNDFLCSLNIINAVSKINICRDPKDNMFLECAIDGKCSYITSGDKDLLVLEEYKGIKILKPSEFLVEYEAAYQP